MILEIITSDANSWSWAEIYEFLNRYDFYIHIHLWDIGLKFCSQSHPFLDMNIEGRVMPRLRFEDI